MITDTVTNQQQKLDTLKQVRPAYEDALPADRVKILFDIANKVVAGAQKPDEARRYLEAL